LIYFVIKNGACSFVDDSDVEDHFLFLEKFRQWFFYYIPKLRFPKEVFVFRKNFISFKNTFLLVQIEMNRILKKTQKFFYSTEEKLTGRKIRLNGYQLDARLQRGAFVDLPPDADQQKPSFDGNPFLTPFEYDETVEDVKFVNGPKYPNPTYLISSVLLILIVGYILVLSVQPKGLKYELNKSKEFLMTKLNFKKPGTE
jgi:hypothetical protein